QRSGDRLVIGGILVDDEHTHAGKLPFCRPLGRSGRSRFPYCDGVNSRKALRQRYAATNGEGPCQCTRRACVTFGTLLNLRSTRASCSRSTTDTVTSTWAVPASRSVVVVIASILSRSSARTSVTSRTRPRRSNALIDICTARPRSASDVH